MARAHVTEELIKVVKVQHKKHPASTQKELAERIGCSAATVGRILAGKYDKVKVDDDSDKMYTYGELDPKTGKVKTAKDTGNEQNFTFDDPVRDENGKIHFVPREPQKPKSIPDLESIIGDLRPEIVVMTREEFEEMSKRLDELDERFRRPPMEKDKFRYKVMTEIQTLRETQVDLYKELRQIKGILGELRDIWKK